MVHGEVREADFGAVPLAQHRPGPLRLGAVLHLHHRVDDDGRELFGHLGVHQRDLDLVQHLERLDLGQIKALGDDPGVEALLDVGVGLLEELPDQQDGGGGAVPGDVVLGGGGPARH